MSGQGIPKLLDQLSALLRFPVYLLGPYLQPIFGRVPAKTAAQLEALLTGGGQIHVAPSLFSAFSLLGEGRNVNFISCLYP